MRKEEERREHEARMQQRQAEARNRNVAMYGCETRRHFVFRLGRLARAYEGQTVAMIEREFVGGD